jgi:hypothetical protein
MKIDFLKPLNINIKGVVAGQTVVVIALRIHASLFSPETSGPALKPLLGKPDRGSQIKTPRVQERPQNHLVIANSQASPVPGAAQASGDPKRKIQLPGLNSRVPTSHGPDVVVIDLQALPRPGLRDQLTDNRNSLRPRGSVQS